MSNEGDLWSGGIAYVALPQDIDRSIYINECYRSGRISIKMEDGSLFNQAPISLEILNFIDFPLKAGELGSAVVFLNEAVHNHPIIVGRVQKSDELGSGRERVFQIYRKFNDKLVGLIGDVERGVFSLNVNAGDKVGQIYIGLDNDANDNTLEIEVAGDVVLKTTNKTLIENQNEFRSVISKSSEDKDEPSVIAQTRDKILAGAKQVVINGEEISAIHYKGYRITINDNGISIDALDKDVIIQSGDSKVQLKDSGILIEGGKISLNGSYEVLYNKVPGAPIANVGQIGVSKKVRVG
jgi:hypothetical protein